MTPLRAAVAISLMALAIFLLVVSRARDAEEAALTAPAPSTAPPDATSPLDDEAANASDAKPPATLADEEAVARRIAAQPVTTPKAKLLKDELQKRAERRVASARPPTTKPAAPVPPTGAGDVVLAGDADMQRAFRRALGATRVVTSAPRGFHLSLTAAGGTNRGAVYTQCSAAVSELPNKKLVASLSSRAEATGASRAEVKDACAASLADDVAAWLRKRR